MANNETRLALKPRTEIASELVFADEGSVRQHYAPMIQQAGKELTTRVRASVQDMQQQAKSKSNLIAGGLAVGAVVIAGLTISTIITGIIGISLLGITGATAVTMRYRYPVWVAKLRAKQVVDLAQAEYQKQLNLEAAQEKFINDLRQRAANDPVTTRKREANDWAQEIVDADSVLANFEGLIETQQGNITAAKKEFPDESFESAETGLRESHEAKSVMTADLENNRKQLKEYERRTRLIETNLKLAAGMRTMAEFMRDDGASDRIRKMVSEVATESAEQEFQTARAAMRTSVAAAKRRLQQQ